MPQRNCLDPYRNSDGLFIPSPYANLHLLPPSPPFPAASGLSVEGQAEPVVAPLGADASLPCRLAPEQSMAHMSIRWYRGQPSRAVLVFRQGQEQVGEQMLEYRGRAELLRDAVGSGSVALLLRRVRASDDGLYHCRFEDGDVSQEALVQLNVVGKRSWLGVQVVMGSEG